MKKFNPLGNVTIIDSGDEFKKSKIFNLNDHFNSIKSLHKCRLNFK